MKKLLKAIVNVAVLDKDEIVVHIVNGKTEQAIPISEEKAVHLMHQITDALLRVRRNQSLYKLIGGNPLR